MKAKLPRILVTGADGQVGHSLLTSLNGVGDILAADLKPMSLAVPFYQVDFADKSSVLALLEQTNPDIVVNPAAYTAVDRAESDQALAQAVNSTALELISGYCKSRQVPLIHFSTDYVFPGDGEHFRTEDEPTGPVNFYGLSKLGGEMAIKRAGCTSLIFRTSWVFSSHGQNFVKTMIRLGAEKEELKVVSDQIGAPTSARFLATMVRHVIDVGLVTGFESYQGTYHLCNSGETSWFEFAKEIFKMAEMTQRKLAVKKVYPIPTEAYPTPARRPKNSRLSCEKFKKSFGVMQLQPWQAALLEVIQEYRG
jgi:dTDP-4-dehydrorhamnose reductase